MNERWLNSDPVVVRRSDQQWEFRPTLLRADITFSLFLLVSVGNLTMAGFMFWMGRDSPIGVIFGSLLSLIAAWGFWRAMRARRLQHTPLVVQSDGRVCYGNQELCPAESVQAVQLKRVASGEDYNYNVSLVLTAGADVELPSPYFTGFLHRQEARWFAAKFAAALRLELVEPG